MQNRRQFLKTTLIGSAGVVTAVRSSARAASGRFDVHPFIRRHPEAVFVMRTSVDERDDAEGKLRAGLAFGKSVYKPHVKNGVPVTTSIPMKPNFKTSPDWRRKGIPIEDVFGTGADPFFIEGMLESMKELGIKGNQFHMREVNRPESFASYGFVDMARRVGADLRLDLAPEVGRGLEEGRDYNWTEVPDGVAYRKIPHLEPINTDDTWMLNIAKFKTHPMGMTLCCKNLQGSVAHNYQQFCNPRIFRGRRADAQPRNAEKTIKKNYERHVREGIIPRWDRPGMFGGQWMEIWSNRTIDNVTSTPCALHIIDGIFGRDGSAGSGGPHPLDREHRYNLLGGSATGRAKDFPCNYIIFGRNAFLVDVVGHWLGGHEPGNFGFFHLAVERGALGALDPRTVPIYLWEDGAATPVPAESWERAPLLTMYLRRDYEGGDEPFYHMVDQPFDYSRVSGLEPPRTPKEPAARLLDEIAVDEVNPSVSIEFELPAELPVRIEIADSSGAAVSVPVEGVRRAGVHLVSWDTSVHRPGKYTYRFSAGDYSAEGAISIEK